MRSDPKEILNEWIAHVNGGEIEKILKLYHREAVLIPTFSSRILDRPDLIRDYFVKLGSREELSLALHANNIPNHSVGGGIFSISGIYCWRFLVEKETFSFEARFSYLLDLKNENPILHHHSSQVPQTI